MLIDRLRQPAYTGENRCLPCTVLNVVIGAIGAVALAAVVRSRVGIRVSIAVGAVAFAVTTALIAVRGYLVPGTPQLTQTYLPDRVRDRIHDRPVGVDDDADLDLALRGVAMRADDDRDEAGSPDRPAS